MPESETLKQGIEMFTRIFGPDYGAELAKQLYESASDFNDIVMGKIAPEIWGLREVDIPIKLLCCIAIFTALNRDEIKFFVRGAIYHGITRQQINEIILLAGLESGFPGANAAYRRANEAYAEHEAFMKKLGKA
jgi:alkylhydroperoxidase/carboxymuconolactone decarboxylase family protein YurZ